MRVEAVKAFLKEHGVEEGYCEFEASCATVELAAAALGIEPGRIAKSLTFSTANGPLIVVAMGTARVDNKKFREQFGHKADMAKADQLEALVGHPMGGVCPFALLPGVPVYLDESLRNYDPVYPSAGSPNNMARMSLADLARVTGGVWVDVCKT